MRTFSIIVFFAALLVASLLMVAQAKADDPPPEWFLPQIETRDGYQYVRHMNQEFGPYDHVYIHGVINSKVCFEVQHRGSWYVHWGTNEPLYGPHEEVRVYGGHDAKLLVVFRDNGGYYVRLGDTIWGKFDRIGRARYDDGRVYAIVIDGNITVEREMTDDVLVK